MRKVIYFMFLVLIGCSTNPHVIKPVSDNLEGDYGRVDGQRIGLNDKKEVVIQKERSGEAELKIQQMENAEAEQKVTTFHEKLTQCRKELVDPRLGGTGNMVAIPEIDSMKGTNDAKEEIGLGKNGDFKVVKREYYLDRLKLERRYADTMTEMLKALNRFSRTCTQELGAARVKVGLPAERYEAVGHFEDGGRWVMDRKGEKTLDDAFQIRAMISGERGPASQ